MVTSAEPAHATGRHFADSHTAKNIASASPTINAQTARPTVILAALAKGKFIHQELLLEPFVVDGFVSAIFLHFFQRSVEFLLQLSVALTYRDAEASAEVIFIGHFVAHRRQFRVIFQPLSDHCGVTEDAVDTPVLQIQFCVLVAVIRNGSDFRVLIHNEFLVCRPVLYADFLPFS